MVALVAGMLAVALALPANPGLATISSCDPCTEGQPEFLRQLAGKDDKVIRDTERWESL